MRFERLTPKVGVFVDNSWIARNWGVTQRFGFDTTNVGIKWEVYRNNPNEALVDFLKEANIELRSEYQYFMFP